MIDLGCETVTTKNRIFRILIRYICHFFQETRLLIVIILLGISFLFWQYMLTCTHSS